MSSFLTLSEKPASDSIVNVARLRFFLLPALDRSSAIPHGI